MNTQSIAAETTRAWIDIDLGALLRNGRNLARHAGVPLLPMVKADGYGLGAVAVARTLEALDPPGYGVSIVSEGLELRAAGISRPVLTFTPLYGPDLEAARQAKLVPALGHPEAIRWWIDAGGGDWHLSIDTGMSSAGVRWDEIGVVADLVRRQPPAGAFTHFHSADCDLASLDLQERRFVDAVAALPVRPALLHTQNSAAAVRRAPSRWSFVRPGAFLYGLAAAKELRPEPVASVRARILEIRDLLPGEGVSYGATWRSAGPARIATLGIGYADGYRWSLGNAGTVLVNGMRASVRGAVRMGMTMIDITSIPCERGDVVTLIGTDGSNVISLEEVGAASGISPYEILTGLRQRMTRCYL